MSGATHGEITIRPYEQDDRASVRHICFVTGYMGEPVDWLWHDAESFADLFTSYYTDAEPESALVAEVDGDVAGYLLGCVDSRRAWNPAGLFLRNMIMRQTAFRPGTARMVWRSFGDVALDAARRRLPPAPVHDDRWPAHLHIDLLPRLRGCGVGSRLIRRWLAKLEDIGVPGCHLETIGENHKAIAFFEAMGFERRRKPALAPGLRSPSGDRHTIQLMVRTICERPTPSGG